MTPHPRPRPRPPLPTIRTFQPRPANPPSNNDLEQKGILMFEEAIATAAAALAMERLSQQPPSSSSSSSSRLRRRPELPQMSQINRAQIEQARLAQQSTVTNILNASRTTSTEEAKAQLCDVSMRSALRVVMKENRELEAKMSQLQAQVHERGEQIVMLKRALQRKEQSLESRKNQINTFRLINKVNPNATSSSNTSSSSSSNDSKEGNAELFISKKNRRMMAALAVFETFRMQTFLGSTETRKYFRLLEFPNDTLCCRHGCHGQSKRGGGGER